jgi:hypothetical protein
MKNNFLFVDLAEFGGKIFDGVAAGDWIDRLGRKVKIKASELPEIVKNTVAAIESATTETGELVGLPIDEKDHNHLGGAGWIVGAELEGDIIRIKPNWTEVGTKLIKNNIRRFFSASIDMKNKVILGGTLTNWPASRDEMGLMALRPIELSQQLQAIEKVEPSGPDKSFLKELTASIVETIKGALPSNDENNKEFDDMKNFAEFAKTEEGQKEINALVAPQVEAELAARIELADQKRKIAEFADEVTNDEEKALPLETGRVQAFLEGISEKAPDLLEEAQAILSEVLASGTMDFSEKGHSKKKRGTTELSKEEKKVLEDYLAADEKNTVAEFFRINQADLGDRSDYNLAEFEKEGDK